MTILRIHGPFLFGTTEKLAEATQGPDQLGDVVILRLRNMTALDATGTSRARSNSPSACTRRAGVFCSAVPGSSRHACCLAPISCRASGLRTCFRMFKRRWRGRRNPAGVRRHRQRPRAPDGISATVVRLKGRQRAIAPAGRFVPDASSLVAVISGALDMNFAVT